ncbi:hypothetical protein DW1_1190 [Proteiniborus sp. DW1]|uniref:DUF5700 domain-containing putative Zn-dependent protease n=1 Tax=Proteiniborus sp. DW1 TaxID=1889883 RepID=UPI00092DFBFD|nr:DUF5700 domain-containing putative Zn-dependent protease [Proteiniborus sp. DW1]SCG82763.1 hypothetical protein DW1_1190 [Proteiniborus sp. DW1]
MIHVIDTFKDFKSCFEDKLDLTIKEKIDLWERSYISKYPELEKKCKEDYSLNGYDWRRIAEEVVFNRTKEDFYKMVQAHENILKIMDYTIMRVDKEFKSNLDINIVLYCGLCNSAGWVDTYNDKRAILFGIDKIAELNWHTIEKLESLIAHELCHVVHFEIRGEDDLSDNVDRNYYNRGIWNLYEEGFAQYFQYGLLEKEVDSRGREWFEKCKIKEKQLKNLYLKALFDKEKGTQDFFGDWFKVLGISDTGYYLGAKFIRVLDMQYSIEKIARLPFKEIEKHVLEFLRD